MTRPIPTQGAQSEAARVPRVSKHRRRILRSWAKNKIARKGLYLDFAIDVDALLDDLDSKDATIADLKRTIGLMRAAAEAGAQAGPKLLDLAYAREEALQAQLTEAEQRAATAERRGSEAGRDAAVLECERRANAAADEARKRWRDDGEFEWRHVERQLDEAADAIRALVPAVPQEGETTR